MLQLSVRVVHARDIAKECNEAFESAGLLRNNELLQLHCYKDESAIERAEHIHLVISCESIAQGALGDTARFRDGILVVDEACSLACSMASDGTIGDPARVVREIAEISRICKCVIFMGRDLTLTPMVGVLVELFCPMRNVLHVRYEAPGQDNRLVVELDNKKARKGGRGMDRFRAHFQLDLLNIMRFKRERADACAAAEGSGEPPPRMRPPPKLWVAIGKTEFAHKYLIPICAQMGVGHRFYNQATSKAEKRELAETIDKGSLWTGVDVVIATTTITVAVNIKEPMWRRYVLTVGSEYVAYMQELMQLVARVPRGKTTEELQQQLKHRDIYWLAECGEPSDSRPYESAYEVFAECKVEERTNKLMAHSLSATDTDNRSRASSLQGGAPRGGLAQQGGRLPREINKLRALGGMYREAHVGFGHVMRTLELAKRNGFHPTIILPDLCTEDSERVGNYTRRAGGCWTGRTDDAIANDMASEPALNYELVLRLVYKAAAERCAREDSADPMQVVRWLQAKITGPGCVHPSTGADIPKLSDSTYEHTSSEIAVRLVHTALGRYAFAAENAFVQIGDMADEWHTRLRAQASADSHDALEAFDAAVRPDRVVRLAEQTGCDTVAAHDQLMDEMSTREANTHPRGTRRLVFARLVRASRGACDPTDALAQMRYWDKARIATEMVHMQTEGAVTHHYELRRSIFGLCETCEWVVRKLQLLPPQGHNRPILALLRRGPVVVADPVWESKQLRAAQQRAANPPPPENPGDLPDGSGLRAQQAARHTRYRRNDGVYVVTGKQKTRWKLACVVPRCTSQRFGGTDMCTRHRNRRDDDAALLQGVAAVEAEGSAGADADPDNVPYMVRLRALMDAHNRLAEGSGTSEDRSLRAFMNDRLAETVPPGTHTRKLPLLDAFDRLLHAASMALDVRRISVDTGEKLPCGKSAKTTYTATLRIDERCVVEGWWDASLGDDRLLWQETRDRDENTNKLVRESVRARDWPERAHEFQSNSMDRYAVSGATVSRRFDTTRRVEVYDALALGRVLRALRPGQTDRASAITDAARCKGIVNSSHLPADTIPDGMFEAVLSLKAANTDLDTAEALRRLDLANKATIDLLGLPVGAAVRYQLVANAKCSALGGRVMYGALWGAHYHVMHSDLRTALSRPLAHAYRLRYPAAQAVVFGASLMGEDGRDAYTVDKLRALLHEVAGGPVHTGLREFYCSVYDDPDLEDLVDQLIRGGGEPGRGTPHDVWAEVRGALSFIESSAEWSSLLADERRVRKRRTDSGCDAEGVRWRAWRAWIDEQVDCLREVLDDAHHRVMGSYGLMALTADGGLGIRPRARDALAPDEVVARMRDGLGDAPGFEPVVDIVECQAPTDPWSCPVIDRAQDALGLVGECVRRVDAAIAEKHRLAEEDREGFAAGGDAAHESDESEFDEYAYHVEEPEWPAGPPIDDEAPMSASGEGEGSGWLDVDTDGEGGESVEAGSVAST